MQISLDPRVYVRVSGVFASSRWSVCHPPPFADMSAPPPHRQKAPISTAPESSAVCSQLPCWLSSPRAMPTHPQGSLLNSSNLPAYVMPHFTRLLSKPDTHIEFLNRWNKSVIIPVSLLAWWDSGSLKLPIIYLHNTNTINSGSSLKSTTQ